MRFRARPVPRAVPGVRRADAAGHRPAAGAPPRHHRPGHDRRGAGAPASRRPPGRPGGRRGSVAAARSRSTTAEAARSYARSPSPGSDRAPTASSGAVISKAGRSTAVSGCGSPASRAPPASAPRTRSCHPGPRPRRRAPGRRGRRTPRRRRRSRGGSNRRGGPLPRAARPARARPPYPRRTGRQAAHRPHHPLGEHGPCRAHRRRLRLLRGAESLRSRKGEHPLPPGPGPVAIRPGESRGARCRCRGADSGS